jgi:non-homologous end joining protein Ku
LPGSTLVKYGSPDGVTRSIWSGAISLGLVSVGVRMFPATESKELRFHFLDRRDLMPIAYEKVRRDARVRRADEEAAEDRLEA